MLRIGLSLALVAAVVTPGHAQFEEVTGEGPRLGEESMQRVQIGVRITAQAGPCGNIIGTTAIPMDWPEQTVTVVEEDISPQVTIEYYQPAPTVKQMIIRAPSLPAGQQAHALVTFEIRRRAILPPEDTSTYRVPEKLDRALRMYLAPSPYIETRNGRIRAAAREAVAGKETAWEKVESIYDYVREKVEYRNGPLKGAAKALRDGTGDCEELTSLFIAMCRINKIPARTVWVPGHCYPEFYLEDDEGRGHWFPCQAAGTRAFGGIPEKRAILQKGDNFRLPEHDKPQRYVAEFLKAASISGGVPPKVSFVREVVYGQGGAPVDAEVSEALAPESAGAQ